MNTDKQHKNPYQFRTPVVKPPLFVGREKEINKTLELLHSSNVSVFGPHHIGLTSFLLHIKDVLCKSQEFSSFQIVYVDLRTIEANTLGALLLSILREICKDSDLLHERDWLPPISPIMNFK